MIKFSVPQNGQTLLKAWKTASALPGGKRAFSKFLGRVVPYTATIDATVEELSSGYARLTMKDRSKVRNHLRSVHALALANLGEEVSGIAMMSQLEPGMRGIVTAINIEYLKKARGTLTGVSRAPALVDGQSEYQAPAEITDEAGDVVARFVATWQIDRRG